MYVQVHVSDILNITSRTKRIQTMVLFFWTCLGSLQMFSSLSNGKLHSATILVSESSFNPPAPTGKQWHNSTTKEGKWKEKRKKSVKEEPFSLFPGLSPLFVASFRLASFHNVKMWFVSHLILLVFFKSLSDINSIPYFVTDVFPNYCCNQKQ